MLHREVIGIPYDSPLAPGSRRVPYELDVPLGVFLDPRFARPGYPYATKQFDACWRGGTPSLTSSATDQDGHIYANDGSEYSSATVR